VLSILSVAYPFAPVHSDSVGDAEQILAAVDARLVREGHNSIVIAAAGSRIAGQLVSIPAPTGWIDRAARADAARALHRELTQLCRERAIDVVHLHGIELAELDLPTVATLHLPRAYYPPDALATPRVHKICVSQTQRATLTPDIEIAGVIENGISVERYGFATKQGFALALGQICPDKGYDLALRAAHDAGVPLVLAGRVFPYPSHHDYMTTQIEPLLDAHRRWIGPVAGELKRRLLAKARCLVIASTVEEAGSLVAMEALASGTPVVGLRRGALAEIVEHGRTGWLVDEPGELAAAITLAGELSPAECRAVAVARFSASQMTARYLDLYARVAKKPRRRAADIAVATDDREVTALADDWDALCTRCPTATPFQRPSWLLPWRRRFGAGASPRVATLRAGGRLVGLIPLELRDGIVRLIGEGITDYLDAIVEPDIDVAMITEAVRAAAGARAIELSALRPCSPLWQLDLGGALGDALASPVVALDAVAIPDHLAYAQRRLARFPHRWLDETGDRNALLSGLFALLDDPEVAHFHAEVAGELARRGLLRLVGLEINGTLRAVLYGFADHGRFLYYLSGFDPAITKLSPGRLLVARAIERARDDGAFELDFLRGCEPYKYEWGAIDRPATVYRLGRPLSVAR
jgi:CelD/BcsL family acetyltransferase involved in cellulose biosynthesis/glycosyltransferase involved in cell wall biosynthesis